MIKEVLLIIMLSLFLMSCSLDGSSDIPYEEKQSLEKNEEDNPIFAPDDNSPSISTTVSPSTLTLGSSFTLTVSVEDADGIQQISWESNNSFSNYANWDSYDCNNQQSCSYTWELMTQEEGLHYLSIIIKDSNGHSTTTIAMAEVYLSPPSEVSPPQDALPKPEELVDKSADSATSESPASDNSHPPSVCGNGLCEGGESYQNCPEECDIKEIIGTIRGDGYCEPGEDAKNSNFDCNPIKPNCGNGLCDSEETKSSCSHDCEGKSSDSEEKSGSSVSCDSHSDCGYKQRCIGSVCQSVECTSDSHCSGCRKCSGNQCVSCGQGPYGCYC